MENDQYPYAKQVDAVTTGDVLDVPGGAFEVNSVATDPTDANFKLFTNPRGTQVLKMPRRASRGPARVDVVGQFDVEF